jgi:hypothetical protein
VRVILPVVVGVDCLDFNFTIENFLHVDNPETNVSMILHLLLHPAINTCHPQATDQAAHHHPQPALETENQLESTCDQSTHTHNPVNFSKQTKTNGAGAL